MKEKSVYKNMNLIFLLFLFGLIAKIILPFTSFFPPLERSNIPADYSAGVAQVVNYSFFKTTEEDIKIMLSHNMYYIPYTTYWPYLPFTNYFRAFIVMVSGHDIEIFDKIYILLIILCDVLIFFLIIKILKLRGVSEELCWLCALLYFLSPMTIDNLRWRSTNNFVVFLLMLSIYFYLNKKIWRSAITIGLGIAMKILPIFALPFFITQVKEDFKENKMLFIFILLALSIPIITTIPTFIKIPKLFIKNCFFWGAGTRGGNFRDSIAFLSFMTLFNLLGICLKNTSICSWFFVFAYFISLVIIYFYLRNEDLEVQVFFVFLLLFLFHNIIESHHFVFLHAFFALVTWRFNFYKKISPIFIGLPVLWYFSTPTGFGTRLIRYKFGINIPYKTIVIFFIILLKIFLILLIIQYLKEKETRKNYQQTPS